MQWGSRYREAVGRAEGGLALLPRMTSNVRDEFEASLLTTGAFCCYFLVRYGSEDAARMLHRLENMLDRIITPSVLDAAHWAISVHAWVRGNFSKTRTFYELGLLCSGQAEQGYARILQSIESFDAIGSKNAQGGFHSWLSIALSKLQRWDEARRAADFAILRCHETGESLWLPWALHARGVAEGSYAVNAERWLKEAIQTASAQKNRLLEIRAANSLAQTWMTNGRSEEARTLLAPLSAKFEANEPILDVKEARALLQQL